MEIVNHSDWTVYWRTFRPDDTWYIAGNADGLIEPGSRRNVNLPMAKVQMEFKWSNFIGSFIRQADPGELWTEGHSATIAADYSFRRQEPAAAPAPVFTPTGTETTYYGTTYKFFDLLGAPDSELEQSTTLSVSEARVRARTDEDNSLHEVGWGLSLGFQGGGGEEGGGSGAASGSWHDTATRELKSRREDRAEQARSVTGTRTFTALGGRLTVVVCHWNAQVELGTVTCGDEVYDYRATIDVDSTIELATYAADQLDDLPPETREAWEAQTGRAGT